MHLGPPNPLEECMSQFLDTKLASQRWHMELFDEKLTKSTTFGDRSLVNSIGIEVCNKRYPCIVFHTKLWITEPCHVQKTSYLALTSIMLYI